VKTFFRADVEWLRTQEKAKEVRSPKFSYALPELRLLDEQIDLLLINNYTFGRKEFDVTADKCIHFLLNYLCRPEWTLNSFFFDTVQLLRYFFGSAGSGRTLPRRARVFAPPTMRVAIVSAHKAAKP